MKKRILILALAVVLLMTAASSALAVETSGGTQDTQFEYTVASGFTVTIPASVTVTGDAGTLSISVTAGSKIDAAKSMSITITDATNYDTTGSKFRLKCTTGTDVFLNYGITLTAGNTPVAKGTAFATYTAALVNAGQTCGLTLTPAIATQAGTYTDSLTFTVTVA